VRVGDSVSILDLDHFKQLNDAHGHAAGGAVLAAFGQVIRRHMRGTDIAGRYGGEEFVVALTAVLPATLVTRLADIRRSWNRSGRFRWHFRPESAP
jgi:diguanylate cyclase (GGDEF)-like protein